MFFYWICEIILFSCLIYKRKKKGKKEINEKRKLINKLIRLKMNLILLFGFLSILSQRVAPVCVKKTTTDNGNNAAETESKNIISTTLDTTKTITTTTTLDSTTIIKTTTTLDSTIIMTTTTTLDSTTIITTTTTITTTTVITTTVITTTTIEQLPILIESRE
jgi:hypothetical protein